MPRSARGLPGSTANTLRSASRARSGRLLARQNVAWLNRASREEAPGPALLPPACPLLSWAGAQPGTVVRHNTSGKAKIGRFMALSLFTQTLFTQTPRLAPFQ